jgi:hypothetical protein
VQKFRLIEDTAWGVPLKKSKLVGDIVWGVPFKKSGWLRILYRVCI